MVIYREKEKLIGPGLAGLQRNGALVAARECRQHHIISNLANFFDDLQTVAWSLANGIEIEKDGVQRRPLQRGLDLVFVGGHRNFESVAKVPAEFRENFWVVGNHYQRVAFGFGASFAQ